MRWEIWRAGNYRKVGFGINSRQANQAWVNTDDIIEYGQWMHFAGTYDGENLKIYVNGELHGTEPASSPLMSTNDILTIGAVKADPSAKFGGNIDEVRLWNYALDGQQIQENMYNNLSGYEDGLVGYWNFNDGDGDVLNDLSPNGNNGTIFGAVWSDNFPQPPVSYTHLTLPTTPYV